MGETIRNSQYEEIHIKLDGKKILVHHTACTKDFIPFEELCLSYVVNAEEILRILDTAKKLYLPTLIEQIKDKF